MNTIIAKIKTLVKASYADIILIVAIALITFTSFRFGQMSSDSNPKKAIVFKEAPEGYSKIPELGSKPSKITYEKSISTLDISKEPVYASKKSKNKYFHYKSCPSFKQLSQTNLITFLNASDAISKGYTQAPNCNL